MKRACAMLVSGMFLFSAGAAYAKGAAPDGKKLFETHCAACHADGGNIINPQKTLKKGALAKGGIKKPEDIVKTMRNPGPGMQNFDEKTVPDKDAKAIGEYILKTFK